MGGHAKYTLRYLPVAQEDLISILDYIAKDNPGRALAFVDKLDDHIKRLENHPFLGRVPRHPKLNEFGYRVMIVESYLVFYIIRGKQIEIHRIIHGSRNLDHLI
ncbi:MAG: type II toxin-antitoxin system RelE/ParE family toxin [Bacteroidota bacterium]|nr:type II toxin-antitoxin system RelE/ParE family toxin [Bacteroidota bacterium]